MPDMDLGDVTIHYEEAGEGSLAYVFCHGLDRDNNEFGGEFTDQLDFWKDRFGRAVTWDHRGMGRSSEAADYSLPLYASDLARLLDGLDTLLGFFPHIEQELACIQFSKNRHIWLMFLL